MGDDEASGAQQQAIAAQVLGGAPTIDDGTMDDLIDKLKLLNYEVDFCPTITPPFKPLTRSFFQGPSDNANAQFYYFTSLTSWLMNSAGHKGFPRPDQFDDPTATATTIVQELKAMNVPTKDLAPNKIRQGHGDAVLTILSYLVDRALLSKGFAFRGLIYPTAPAKADQIQDIDDGKGGAGLGGAGDDSDIDDNIGVDSDDGDEIYVHHKKPAGGVAEEDDDTGMIVSQVSPEAWALEVERVGPSLQLRGDDVRDWRARIENAQTLLKAVEKMYPDVRVMLENMGSDVKKAKERIEKREQTLAQQFNEQVEDYRVKLRDLNSTQDSFNASSQAVGQLSVELNQVSEMLEQVKNEIQDREGKISDTTPLMKIKEAVAKVRAEIKDMSLRIGILQHTVLHYTLRQSAVKRERRTGKPAAEDEDDDPSM